MKVYLKYKLVNTLNTTTNKMLIDAIRLGYNTVNEIKRQYPFIYDQYLFVSINDLTDAGILEIDVLNKKVFLSKGFNFINHLSDLNTSLDISESNIKLLEKTSNEDIKHVFFEAISDIEMDDAFKTVLHNINIIIEKDIINEQR